MSQSNPEDWRLVLCWAAGRAASDAAALSAAARELGRGATALHTEATALRAQALQARQRSHDLVSAARRDRMLGQSVAPHAAAEHASANGGTTLGA
jgi:hypothetical protein